jgi:hypothetical protein
LAIGGSADPWAVDGMGDPGARRAQEVAAADATHEQYRDLRALRCGGATNMALPALTSLWRPWLRPPDAQPPPPAAGGRQPLAAAPMATGLGSAELLRAYARLTTRAGDRLARRALRIKAALHRLSPASVWFTR